MWLTKYRKKLGLSVWIQEWKSGVEGNLTSKLEVLTPNLPPVLIASDFFLISYFDTENGFDDCRKLNLRKFHFGIIRLLTPMGPTGWAPILRMSALT